MKWTTKLPTTAGYYWVKFTAFDIHQQGPMVFEVDIIDEKLLLLNPGGDHIRTLEDVEEEFSKIEYWSDTPIPCPEEEVLGLLL